MNLPLYVYAYDRYGAVTYFRVSTLSKRVRANHRLLEDYLVSIASKKLGVSPVDVRLGKYSDQKFNQEHLPARVYPGRGGRWLSYTTDG